MTAKKTHNAPEFDVTDFDTDALPGNIEFQVVPEGIHDILVEAKNVSELIVGDEYVTFTHPKPNSQTVHAITIKREQLFEICEDSRPDRGTVVTYRGPLKAVVTYSSSKEGIRIISKDGLVKVMVTQTSNNRSEEGRQPFVKTHTFDLSKVANGIRYLAAKEINPEKLTGAAKVAATEKKETGSSATAKKTGKVGSDAALASKKVKAESKPEPKESGAVKIKPRGAR